MLKRYIAAGFDPARFWLITPRLFCLEMQGAALRQENKRAEIWVAAALQRCDELPSFEAFVTGKSDNRAALVRCVDAWEKMDRSLMMGK